MVKKPPYPPRLLQRKGQQSDFSVCGGLGKKLWIWSAGRFRLSIRKSFLAARRAVKPLQQQVRHDPCVLLLPPAGEKLDKVGPLQPEHSPMSPDGQGAAVGGNQDSHSSPGTPITALTRAQEAPTRYVSPWHGDVHAGETLPSRPPLPGQTCCATPVVTTDPQN